MIGQQNMKVCVFSDDYKHISYIAMLIYIVP